MTRFSLFSAVGLSALTLAACAPTLGPPPPGGRPMGRPVRPEPPPSGPASFSAADFAWAQAPGRNGIQGQLGYRNGGGVYTCAGSGVVLTPETPWSRRRMTVLYGSAERAALPADEVRKRTPSAPPGDAGPFVKRTTCDANSRFSFTGLPNGAWYAITIARPAGQPQGATVALMRRVVTRGGRVTQVTF
ncbi:hypothetical protein LRS10_11470 [Phenylobacterium sp. J426]|uniref:hypothetical protein n=1 Tax=Phenylobacterium sp. J426 TaxID=2898439 RepID=UPI002150A898|nr:hypothetical protein [Phenylobacterium sp. J426]MCR5874731.1 hypothetical protein [Phenylobacterium sp. J426]